MHDNMLKGIDFKDRRDEERYMKLKELYNTGIRTKKVCDEMEAIMRRAKWSIEAIMRREG